MFSPTLTVLFKRKFVLKSCLIYLSLVKLRIDIVKTVFIQNFSSLKFLMLRNFNNIHKKVLNKILVLNTQKQIYFK
jgi:hypothetical protein